METYILVTTKEINMKQDLSINTLQTNQNIILYKVSNKILDNIIHKGNSLTLSNIDLSKFNVFNYKLNKEQIVIPILNILYSNLILYIEQYNDIFSLSNLYNLLLLNSYFKESNFNYLNYFFNNIVSFQSGNYKNINDKFINRRFKHYTTQNKKENYSLELSNFEKYIDISIDYNKELDNIHENVELSNLDIYNIFLTLDTKHRFLLFCNLLICEKYSNNVINNYDLLNMMRDMIIMFGPLFRYLLSYTWIKLYKDECTKSENLNYIFDINTASLLFKFPFDYKNPTSNPYMPLLVNQENLNPSSNFIGYLNNNQINMICNQEQFQRRFNIFCTNNNDTNDDGKYNLFENYNFIENNCYIIGSSLTACVQLNPMGLNILKHNIKNYFDEYYNSSDIDIMYLEKDILCFIDKVLVLLDQIDINIKNFYDVTTTMMKKNIKKTLCLVVTKQFIHDNISENIKFIIDQINTDQIINLFEPFHIKLCEEHMRKYSSIDRNKYADIYNDSNIIYTIKIDSKNELSHAELKLSIKYLISSPYLSHPLEIFNVDNDNVVDIVSNFHMPCVRLFYNGIITKIFPSCISAIATSMCLDYKYMSSTKSPMSILANKKKLGFGTWINNSEKLEISRYIYYNYEWKGLIPHIRTNIDNYIFQPIYNTSKLLKPKIYMRTNIHNTIGDRYINYDMNDIIIDNSISKEIYKIFKSVNICGINYDMFKSINSEGDVLPVKKWIIETTWNIYIDFPNEVD